MSPLDRALDEFRRLHPRKIDLGLSRIETVLERLDRPQDKLPTSVHIAGTNGKGSTVAFLRAMLEASGARVHVYTSPHLVRFNERIVLAGQEIDDASLIDVLHRVRDANDGAPLSFFEATTAAAFLAFAETPADYAIIEVGLGGRFDATNVFTPAVCAITPIDYDHAEFLGRDIAGIAREKAGIMKPGRPVLSAPQREQVMAVLNVAAKRVGAPLIAWGQDFRAYPENGRLVFETETELMDLPPPALAGGHQVMNAGLAIAVARTLGLARDAVADGLRQAVWPARMQRMGAGPLIDMAHESGADVWLDGGHNPHAARALSTHMASLEGQSARPLILIMGILANKNAGEFLDFFQGLAAGLVAVEIDDHASLSPDVLSELAQSRGMATTIGHNLTDAMQKAINMGEALSRQSADQPVIPPRILICGSLYLAGQVLTANG
ncbi:bifunctional folylpolyglutamate synthase/dihydrofolate synthase [Algimonas porphyrae]|uniref:Dihydrofolate synthase/folylpolyglutamate synthase n=1 Tax=Algimonas porphyrae TaxID=1128113 RepID=A0ABQ5V2W7_9PROT|nr:folylpolyglutamate synthase/dihydrofolate synthase family protein [Algimonas porphyrae]GLQ21317.1 bifunctional folylpolyglutamate synthase/dihydrofolate synthase [Algimonas porphyrae]